jgi:hypothetical protein
VHRPASSRLRGTAALAGAVALASLAWLVPGQEEARAAPAVAPTAAGDYVSRPDITAPDLDIDLHGGAMDGLLLTTPASLVTGASGVALYDNSGELVWWLEPEGGNGYFNAEFVIYRGRPAIATFEFPGLDEYGQPLPGECVLFDTSYNEIARFGMRGYPTDTHEVEFSPDGKRVLLLSYQPVTVDLSEYGGPADAVVIDTIVQEQRIATGEVTFEWSALESVPLTETEESLAEPGLTGEFDPYHVNSLQYDVDGSLLVSARNTSTVYKLDRDTGDIVWRFGGENSDFTFDDAADEPSYQHDARLLPDGTLTLFDNGNTREPQHSRGVTYALDTRHMTADLIRDLQPEEPVYSPFAGSNRAAPNGNQFVSYGATGQLIEFDGARPVLTAQFEGEWVTYRTERAQWHAVPDAAPDAVVGERERNGSREVAMSWNGATDVGAWRITSGGKHLATVPATGFETIADVTPPRGASKLQITPLHRNGYPLDTVTVRL